MQNYSVKTGLSLHQALAFCFIKDFLPQPIYFHSLLLPSLPPPAFPISFVGQTGLLGKKKNNPVLHCPFKLILCCLRMTEANTTYIKICSLVSSDDFRNLFNAQSWETIVSSSWASTFYRFVYCFSQSGNLNKDQVKSLESW